MANTETGYGKPPLNGRFQPGVSGNPKGRPKKKDSSLAERIGAVLDTPISYIERGKTKVVARRELTLKLLVDKAVGGDLQAASTALRIRVRAERHRESGVDPIFVENWMPDYPSQTAGEKTADVETQRSSSPTTGWRESND
jgi:hypothetical protein